MPYTITCSCKVFALAKALVLFISVDVLFEFAMLPDLYILLSSQGKEVHSSFWGGDVHNLQHIHQKYWTLCLRLYYYISVIHLKNKTVGQLLCPRRRFLAKLLLNWEQQNEEFNCAMALIIKPSSTLHFQIVLGFH